MPPKIVLKLIDAAILPSLLVFGIKFVGLVLLSRLWQFPFTLSFQGLIFKNSAELYKVNTLTNLAQLSLTYFGLFLTLARLTHLVDSALSPKALAKIVDAHLENWVVPLRTAYVEVTVWMSLSLSVTISLLIQGILGVSSFSVFAVSVALLALGTFILLLAVARDLPDSGGETAAVVRETPNA